MKGGNIPEILLWCFFAFQSYLSCEISQSIITLGDNFQLENDVIDNQYTISFVATTDCKPLPQIVLIPNNGTNLTLISFSTKAIDLELPMSSSRKNRPKTNVSEMVRYLKVAYFFKITPDHLQRFSKWVVARNSEIVLGPFQFPENRSSKPTKLFIVADMDISTQSLPTISKLQAISSKDYDMTMIIGDIAYDIEDSGGKNGDDFFVSLATTFSSVPFIMTPGNHENVNQGTLLNYRLRMPNTPWNWNSLAQNHYYDFIYKGVYFISINFDFIFVLQPSQLPTVIEWFSSRLALMANSTGVQWKVFYSHRPIYCNDPTFTEDCVANFYFFKLFDELLLKYSFHLVVNGHLHYYSRLRPMRSLTPVNPNTIGSQTYLQLINGHAGNKYFFPNNSFASYYQNAMAADVDCSNPSYIDLEFTDSMLTITLIDSNTGNTLDSFVLDHSKSNTFNKYLLILIGAILLIFFVVLTIMLLKCFKNSNETTAYETPADQHSEAVVH